MFVWLCQITFGPGII